MRKQGVSSSCFGKWNKLKQAGFISRQGAPAHFFRSDPFKFWPRVSAEILGTLSFQIQFFQLKQAAGTQAIFIV